MFDYLLSNFKAIFFDKRQFQDLISSLILKFIKQSLIMTMLQFEFEGFFALYKSDNFKARAFTFFFSQVYKM